MGDVFAFYNIARSALTSKNMGEAAAEPLMRCYVLFGLGEL